MNQIIWSDIEKGIRFEGTNIFLGWNISIEELIETNNPEVFKSGGHTQLSWGKQNLLDGIEGIWTAFFLPSGKLFNRIGLKYVGEQVSFEKFDFFRENLSLKLGEPTKITEDDGDKSLEWINGQVYIHLYLFNMHTYHCDLIIGTKQ